MLTWLEGDWPAVVVAVAAVAQAVAAALIICLISNLVSATDVQEETVEPLTQPSLSGTVLAVDRKGRMW